MTNTGIYAIDSQSKKDPDEISFFCSYTPNDLRETFGLCETSNPGEFAKKDCRVYTEEVAKGRYEVQKATYPIDM
ncbi:MAG: hypothetical protein ABEK17_02360 [Candidatus Aenigmatarchaeota archaeon]